MADTPHSRLDYRHLYLAAASVAFNTLILLAALDAVSWVVLRVRHPPDETRARATDRYMFEHFLPQLRAAYGKDDETIRRLLRETWDRSYEYDPFTEFRESPSRGEFVNVDAPGVRRSWHQQPWLPASRDAVFVFGGSTTFGYGVADDETLVSHLARELAAKGHPELALYNFGRASYYSVQEAMLFERLLLDGHRPRMVVFVDALNDFVQLDTDTAYSAQLAGAFDSQPPRWLDVLSATALGRVAAGIRRRVRPPDVAATPAPDAAALARVTERYLRTVGLVEAIAGAHGISSVFVAQPVPGYKNALPEHPFYRGREEDFGFAGRGYRTTFAEAVEHRDDARVVWCADVIEHFRGPAWVDEVHYTNGLNAAVAACAADAILARGLLKPPV